ncbi:NADPH-dependent FMN reductase [Hymenobacter rigui]|uniref:NAD(P)H-dependent oxidoreductase n=1 Tax=Hymenobacter rigui TaxID=334424 RepID=A0A3R9MYV5_9BACT|nr:NADPH-dependent FMN reductase [Hymenobacter rigui]RSK44079.1 NAD(P)H-dependent oxidoreductase [Hymenobacter rigui]
MSNPTPKLVGLGGSLRAGSYSAAALRTGLSIATERGALTELLDLGKLHLPLYVPDLPIQEYPPESQAVIEHVVTAFRSADAMLWATPIYHGAMSGAFKNALDYMQLLARDPLPYLQGRAVGLLSIAGPTPLSQMADCVAELRAWVAPTRVTLLAQDFSPELTLTSEVGIRRLTRVVTELLSFKR